ncbi:hypothetical protein OXYTRIMIC_197 [Oxytricha trifallax]|uniref:Uncharacterized protein n=1 Tax=Oxytricha trifallax TaxID=1172189 RepID=A0A073HZM5_9SPIT|nr:hypothetical protein OXYTRIMIC_197 [Oxytricha trifallax]
MKCETFNQSLSNPKYFGQLPQLQQPWWFMLNCMMQIYWQESFENQQNGQKCNEFFSIYSQLPILIEVLNETYVEIKGKEIVKTREVWKKLKLKIDRIQKSYLEIVKRFKELDAQVDANDIIVDHIAPEK